MLNTGILIFPKHVNLMFNSIQKIIKVILLVWSENAAVIVVKFRVFVFALTPKEKLTSLVFAVGQETKLMVLLKLKPKANQSSLKISSTGAKPALVRLRLIILNVKKGRGRILGILK